ncbi:MAG TPA: hypothetical protein VI877_02915 [Dehalococcoidia bacterium]|nr:hypothetical protein [Dehalococcoidia bacterium]
MTHRFFARIRQAELECPRCGEVHRVGRGPEVRKREWDPRTCRFRCRECGFYAILGVLATVPEQHTGRFAAFPDQVPSPDQSRQLRLLGAGQISPAKLKRGLPTNAVAWEATEKLLGTEATKELQKNE